jgi:uncharacterized protein (TIGR02646 family)
MILVAKPPAGPPSLASGIAESATNCAAYLANPLDYDDGMAKFEFKKSIYGNARVKEALKVAQHHKCCYCEARFDANYKGDVEHYRPKGAIGSGKSKILPGYYWLGYSWSNLFYACADCNQYRKRAAFPLVNEALRARNHLLDEALEDPLILNPSGPTNPRDHIRFNLDVPFWLSSTGEETVTRIKLDREALALSRRRHFRLLTALLTIIELNRTSASPNKVAAVADARASLRNAMRPEAEFSAASSDFLEPHRAKWDV